MDLYSCNTLCLLKGIRNCTPGLTTKLSEKLIQEGIARDVIRHVQIMRKNANFAVEDRIIIYGSFDGEIGEAIKTYEKYWKI